MKEMLISLKALPCPKCEGKRFTYHIPEERKLFRGKVLIGKYECIQCGWQSGWNGER